jgi:hypothetical protein
MGILVIRLDVVMHATVLLLMAFVYPGRGHNSPRVLFGDNATEVTNNAALPMSPMVYHDYSIHVTWVFSGIG